MLIRLCFSPLTLNTSSVCYHYLFYPVVFIPDNFVPCCRCCCGLRRSRSDRRQLVDEGCCGVHVSALRQSLRQVERRGSKGGRGGGVGTGGGRGEGGKIVELFHASFLCEDEETPFFVAFDHDVEAVVVAVGASKTSLQV